MSDRLFIPIRITILNWFITVLVGSFVYSILNNYFTKSGENLYQIVRFSGLTATFSGLYSLPALVGMIVVNWFLNKRQLLPRRYQVIHTIVQLLVVIPSFLLLVLGNNKVTYVDLIYLLPLFVTFNCVSLIVWAITFSIYRSKD
ncbi:MAG: hypothetical protein QE487_15275 [Fluviicola sp.]|nr:hypothetical protein [Fluviicola sp.]